MIALEISRRSSLRSSYDFEKDVTSYVRKACISSLFELLQGESSCNDRDMVETEGDLL